MSDNARWKQSLCRWLPAGIISAVFSVALPGGCVQRNTTETNQAYDYSDYEYQPPAGESGQMAGESVTWQQAYLKFRENPADEEAAEQVRKAAASAQANGDARALMALALVDRDTGQVEKAEAGFNEVLKLNPQSAGALWNLGRLAVQRGDLDGAVGYFEKSSSISPDAWQPRYALSQLKRQLGQTQEAERLWKEAKERGAGRTDRYGGMDAVNPPVEMVTAVMEWD